MAIAANLIPFCIKRSEDKNEKAQTKTSCTANIGEIQFQFSTN